MRNLVVAELRAERECPAVVFASGMAAALRARDGELTDGVARDLHDPDERAEAEAAFCGEINGFDYLENRAHRRGRPTREKIIDLHRAWFEGGVPLVIELREDRPADVIPRLG